MPMMWSLRPRVKNWRACSPRKLTFAKMTCKAKALAGPFDRFHDRLRFLFLLVCGGFVIVVVAASYCVFWRLVGCVGVGPLGLVVVAGVVGLQPAQPKVQQLIIGQRAVVVAAGSSFRAASSLSSVVLSLEVGAAMLAWLAASAARSSVVVWVEALLLATLFVDAGTSDASAAAGCGAGVCSAVLGGGDAAVGKAVGVCSVMLSGGGSVAGRGASVSSGGLGGGGGRAGGAALCGTLAGAMVLAPIRNGRGVGGMTLVGL